MLDRQAIAVSLTPGVLLLIAAVVSKWLAIDLAEAVFQFGALAAILGGGTVAWNKVYSQRSMERIAAEKHREGTAYGATGEAKAREEREQELADIWQEQENLSGDLPTMGDY